MNSMNKRLGWIAIGGILGAVVCFALAASVQPGFGNWHPKHWMNDAMWDRDWDFDAHDGDESAWAHCDDTQMVTRELAWTPGDAMTVTLPAEVEYTTGPTAHATVQAPAAIIDHVKLRNRRLTLDRHASQRCAGSVKVILSGPAIREWSLTGVGSLALKNLEQQKLELEVTGTGSVTANGKVKDLDLRLTGTGKAHLSELRSEEADVMLTGVGSAEVQAIDRADIAIIGPGRVELIGQPKQLDSNVIGPGRVVSRNAEEAAQADKTAVEI